MNRTNEHQTQPCFTSTRHLPCSGRAMECVAFAETFARAGGVGARQGLQPHGAVASSRCGARAAANPSHAPISGAPAQGRVRSQTRCGTDASWRLLGMLNHDAARLLTASHPVVAPSRLAWCALRGVRRRAHWCPVAGERHPVAGRAARAVAASCEAPSRAAALNAVVPWAALPLGCHGTPVHVGPARGAAATAAVATAAGCIPSPPYIQAARTVRLHRTTRNNHETRNSDQCGPAGGVPDCHP